MASFSAEKFKYILSKGESATDHRLVGFELEIVRPMNDEREYIPMTDIEQRTGMDKMFAGWGRDGKDIEVVTHPMSHTLIRDDSPLNEMFEFLNGNNYTISWESGTHINISKLNDDPEETYTNMLWISTLFGQQLEKVFGRRSHWARQPISVMSRRDHSHKNNNRFNNAEYLHRLFDIFITPKDAEYFSKQHSKSLLITDKGNRYEFRGAKASINKSEIFAWAQFCYNIVELASHKSMRGAKFIDLIKGDYIEHYFNEEVQGRTERKLTEKLLKMPITYKKEFKYSKQGDKIF